MVSKDQKDLKILNKQLNQLNEEKDTNAQALSKHEQQERDMHAINVQERQVFNQLFESWKKDREFVFYLEQLKLEQDQNRRKIQANVEKKKYSLIRKKRGLHASEERLNDDKRSLR